MDLRTATELEKSFFAQVFNRLPVLLRRGEGVYVFDDKGRRYLDFYSGIAVSSVGHCHPKIVEAVCSQAKKLMHASNWVYTEPQLELSKKIVELTGLERVFLTNDGAGAVETAVKLARKHTGRKGIVSMKNSFHGRSMGALSATWGEKYREPFKPLIPGFTFCEYNDIGSLKDAIKDDTAAVLVEPIQGEAGVITADDGYLAEVRKLTEEKDVLLIADEVQTGFGRTGYLFDYQRAEIEPDILVLAKGMGGGFPIGACVYKGMDFESGQQGGTFNGNPLACSVANAVIDVIESENLAENSRKLGKHLFDNLSGYEVHGRGLMIGLDVDDGRRIALKMLEKGGLVIYSGNTLRLLPPLIINKGDADLMIQYINEVMK